MVSYHIMNATMTQAEIEREIAELEALHEQHRDWRWTQTELAGAIGCDRTTVRQYQQRGLSCQREGRTVLFRPSVRGNELVDRPRNHPRKAIEA